MSEKIKAIRGMKDILPKDSELWLVVEAVIRDIFISYGYKNIRTPIIENTETFSRAIGEVTDIVEKEMYTWQDIGGDSITLRPEGTAGCIRMVIEHNLIRDGMQKLFYQGPMFRHERPQKGRYRQFHQAGVEVFGVSDAKIDAELIAISANIWQKLNIQNVELQINSLGSEETRTKYKKKLYKYFHKNKKYLDKDSIKRLDKNPLRILDSKNKDIQELIANAPKIIDNLDTKSDTHFVKFIKYLDTLQIKYKINPNLVRGLDYYNSTVFEWVSNDLGSQSAICAGGRYDNLVKQMGGADTAGIGFAIGIERLILLLQDKNKYLTNNENSIYFITLGNKAEFISIKICNDIQKNIANIIIVNDMTQASLKSQMKKADKSNACFALILGDEEINKNQIIIKPLRGQGKQEIISIENTINRLKEIL